jgi:hypothetical protein
MHNIHIKETLNENYNIKTELQDTLFFFIKKWLLDVSLARTDQTQAFAG